MDAHAESKQKMEEYKCYFVPHKFMILWIIQIYVLRFRLFAISCNPTVHEEQIKLKAVKMHLKITELYYCSIWCLSMEKYK